MVPVRLFVCLSVCQPYTDCCAINLSFTAHAYMPLNTVNDWSNSDVEVGKPLCMGENKQQYLQTSLICRTQVLADGVSKPCTLSPLANTDYTSINYSKSKLRQFNGFCSVLVYLQMGHLFLRNLSPLLPDPSLSLLPLGSGTWWLGLEER